MKIPTVFLALCTLAFAACAGTPKKECCASSTKACSPNDPNCKAPQDKAHGKHKHP